MGPVLRQDWLRAVVSLKNEQTMSWPNKLLVPGTVTFSTTMMHAKLILMKIMEITNCRMSLCSFSKQMAF